MCDSTDPSKAAELYVMASEMNVVGSHSLLQYKLYRKIVKINVMFIMS